MRRTASDAVVELRDVDAVRETMFRMDPDSHHAATIVRRLGGRVRLAKQSNRHRIPDDAFLARVAGVVNDAAAAVGATIVTDPKHVRAILSIVNGVTKGPVTPPVATTIFGTASNANERPN